MAEPYKDYSGIGFETALSNMLTLTTMAKIAKKRRIERGEQITIVQQKPKPPKQGRNEPCLCGSNKKYKNCCGKG